MSPQCDIIQGDLKNDFLKCEKIIRDLDPNNDWDLSKVYTYDLFYNSGKNGMEDCLPNLFVGGKGVSSLPIPFSGRDKDTSETYGFWFHFLLNNAKGWWNFSGQLTTDFLTVAALAVDHEISEAPGLRSEIMGFATQAFVRKGWTDGFYRMIGSRQVVRKLVDDAIMFDRKDGANRSWTRLWNRNKGNKNDPNQPVGDRSLGDALSVFAGEMNNFSLAGGLAGMMYEALANPAYHNDGGGKTPYEWGNPPESMYPKLRTALSNGNAAGSLDTQVYYKNTDLTDKSGNIQVGKVQFGDKWYYSLYFVVTKNQIHELCSNISCVQSYVQP